MTENSPKNQAFEAALKLYVKHQDGLKGSAMKCSMLALEHFINHGDVSLMIRFYEVMTDNLLRKTAFLVWCCDFAPVKVTSRRPLKMSKDKSETAKKPDLEGASKVLWWDHSPDPELEEYDASTVIKALHSVVSRYRKEEKFKAKEGTPSNVLSLADTAIDQLEKRLISSNVTSDTPDVMMVS